MTRLKIKTELWRYNFSHSGVEQLKDLVMETGGEPLRSVIFSTWRSGTTFLGELLNAVPGNFYHYEPLLNYEIVQIRGPPQSDKAMSYIKSMLNCSYDNIEDYFEYGKTHLNQFTHNTRLWDHCKYRKELCFDAEFTARFCKLFPFQSMKVVRVRLRLAEELLRDHKLNIRVVLLIRDPRGVMQSRQNETFCKQGPDCRKPELLCADMVSDNVTAARLLQSYPEKLMVLRFEELALNPKIVSQKLLKFMRLSEVPGDIDNFLLTHTNADMGRKFTTIRKSQDVPYRWKKLEFSFVDSVQRYGHGFIEKVVHHETGRFCWHMVIEDLEYLMNTTSIPSKL
ncbi:sulfotransferase domain-containing protein [Phthorimaea operculella]|nr:sulfotransferase domain-containing protein [Phthorimaea operculella]